MRLEKADILEIVTSHGRCHMAFSWGQSPNEQLVNGRQYAHHTWGQSQLFIAGGSVTLRGPFGDEYRVLLEDAEREAELQEQRHVLVRVEPRPVQELV